VLRCQRKVLLCNAPRRKLGVTAAMTYQVRGDVLMRVERTMLLPTVAALGNSTNRWQSRPKYANAVESKMQCSNRSSFKRRCIALPQRAPRNVKREQSASNNFCTRTPNQYPCSDHHIFHGARLQPHQFRQAWLYFNVNAKRSSKLAPLCYETCNPHPTSPTPVQVLSATSEEAVSPRSIHRPLGVRTQGAGVDTDSPAPVCLDSTSEYPA
jgi:hypothetical protein